MPFNYVRTHKDFGELKTTNVNGSRFYVTPEGNKYPSITTILSSDPEKKRGLMEWRKRVGEKEANRISSQAARRGTSVHTLCEHHLYNVCPEEPDSVWQKAMPDAIEMFNSMAPILNESVNNIHGQEVALYSDRLGIAGRVDCIAEWNGTLSVIDFKTSRKPKKAEWIRDYYMQCAAYAAMYYERTGIPIKDLVIAVMVENDEPQIFHEKVGKWLPPLKNLIDNFIG
tara:strand:- start:1440 stop:2120 length:681 start_codon:yes stop_codon:yes gene_type:complete